MQFFVYPDASQQSNAYIYSHGALGTNVSALNIICKSSLKVRVVIDWVGGNLVDSTTVSATLVANTWNTIVVSYNGTNLYVGVGQGPGTAIVETVSPPSLGAIAPAGVARIGQSVAGGSNYFNGRIAHPFKSNITMSLSDIQILTAQYRSPGFFPATSSWWLNTYNSPSFDIRGALTITEVSMTYGADGPYLLNTEPFNVDEIVSSAAAINYTRGYFRIG
jgi:hypothetical protein